MVARPSRRAGLVPRARADGRRHRRVVPRVLTTDVRRRQSGISMCVSEFVRVTACRSRPRAACATARAAAPAGARARGVPVLVQLLGGEPRPMAETARIAARARRAGHRSQLRLPGQDASTTPTAARRCLQRAVSRRGGGRGRARGGARAAIPVTAKVRIGWDSSRARSSTSRAQPRPAARAG